MRSPGFVRLGNANPITRLPNPFLDRQLVNLVSSQGNDMPQSLFPRRRRYRTGPAKSGNPVALRHPPSGRTYPYYWQMPPTPSSRAEAYAYGRECAAHLLQWFKDNPAYEPRPAQPHRP